MKTAGYTCVKGEPPPPYQPVDREVLEGGQLAAEAACFCWRPLGQADIVSDALGLQPLQQGMYP